MTLIIIILIVVSLLVIYGITDKLVSPKEKAEETIEHGIKKSKPPKPAKKNKPSISPATSGSGNPLGKIESPSASVVTEPVKIASKAKAKKAAAKKSKNPKNDDDQLLHS
jgi:hypothetical protein